MIIRVCWLAVVALTCCLGADTECGPLAPCYTMQGITNIASGTPGALAPNTLASIYGTNLSFVTRALSAGDIQAGEVPIRLPSTGVQVWLDEWPGHLYLVSPEQVNFLVPSNLRATEVTIRVFRDGTVGPAVRLKLREAAPGLFQLDAEHVLASKLDYSLVTATAPSYPDEWVSLWATGLGAVTPPTTDGILPPKAASLEKIGEFRVLLDGVAVAPGRVGYAGLAPGYAGLYQINLKLPASATVNPEIRIAIGEDISPPNLRLFVSRVAP
jgi:uncharacterized protein (TIGR03437 family)